MHRHGWITALMLAALGACTGKTTNDGASALNGRIPTQHHPVAAACSEPAPPGHCAFQNSAFPDSCKTDGDCADAGPSGRCFESTLGGPALCYCTYDQCSVDADCGSGKTCSCRTDPYHYGSGSTCVPGNCRSDSDCGVGGYCSPSVGPNNLGIVGYYCHTAHDACIDDSDCTATGASAGFCAYSTADSHWECVSLPVPL